jgi:hypothetical protein
MWYAEAIDGEKESDGIGIPWVDCFRPVQGGNGNQLCIIPQCFRKLFSGKKRISGSGKIINHIHKVTWFSPIVFLEKSS